MNTTNTTTSAHQALPGKPTPSGLRSRGSSAGSRGLPVVLLVDDIPDNLLALEGMLRRADVEIVTAGSGREALEVLLERDVAVAIIDVMMPEMDGFELAELIRGVDRTQNVPIIFVTAGAEFESRPVVGYALGAIDFIHKPLNEQVLRAKVDVLVALERQRQEAERARAETEVLLTLAQAISHAEKSAEIYESGLNAVCELLAPDRSAILLFDNTGRMRFRVWRGLSDSYRAAVDGHSPWSREARDAKPILIADVTKDDGMAAYQSIFAAEGIGAIGFVPLVSGELLGKFMLYWRRPREFSEHDEMLAIAIASQIAEALERVRLREVEKRATQTLIDSEARYRTLFEVSVYGVITIEEDGTIETANPAAERIFGYPTKELVGRNISALMPEPYHSQHDSYLKNYRRTGERRIIGIGREVVGRRKDGSQFPMDLAVSEFRVGGKRYFKGLVNDITERKELERARESAIADLTQALRDNEMFAAVLAHDLRNPLGAMINATQLVLYRDEGEEDPVLVPLRRALSSGQRMTRLIEQLLDFTRVRRGGGIELNLHEADLANICGQVLKELELAYPDWKLHVESLGDLGGAWDGDRLLQVFSNLMSNAGEHGTPGTDILVRLDGTAPDYVSIEVHNSGAIPQTLIPDIFSPFRGARQRGSRDGLGLGLFITNEIVRTHGGTVDVASSEAAGTTFTVNLPRRTPSRAAPSGQVS